MPEVERARNPFINSATGGRALSALQLPLFVLRPPKGYAVVTTTGRKTGKTRRRCIRAIRRGEKVYMVAIKGAGTTGWAKNALANPDVRLRLPGGAFSGQARRLHVETERREAEESYCDTVTAFDYLTCMNWRTGRPTRAKIQELLRGWFNEGTPLVVDLDTALRDEQVQHHPKQRRKRFT